MESKFEFKDGDKTYYLKRPTAQQESEARAASAKVFNEAVKRGDLFRAAIDKVMREQGLWDDAKEERVNFIDNEIERLERQLLKGGMSLKEGEKIARTISKLRWEAILIRAGRRQFDTYTVEGQQENFEFDYLMHLCLVNEEDEQIFKSVEEYRKSNDQWVNDAAQKMSEIHYGLNPKWRHDLPENKFLKRFGFLDENLRYTDGKGNFVNSEGKRVNDKGFLINEDGELIDEDGNLIDEKGNPKEVEQPFLDDEGKPILLSE